ncbi:MAG: ATPase [Actinomycetota bacterium]|nr:ATPase [Actinomycetota bacterium]
MTVNEGHDHVDAETLLRRVMDIVNNAKPMPLSTTVRVEKEELIELLEEALNRLPEELRQARWMIKERQEYLAKAQRDGDEILDAARVRAERMVQRTDIVRSAQHLAQKTVDEAREDARRLRHGAEDYCDQKLAALEIVLERTLKTVQAGREKLQVTPAPPGDEGTGGFGTEAGNLGASAGADEAFFDQDQF